MNNLNAVRVAGIYALTGFLWILVSDYFIYGLADTPANITSLQTYKGWAFVFCTALLAFWMTRMALTSQSKLLHSLAESEARWQFALDGAEQGMWDWNIDSGEVFFSNRCKALLGYRDGEIQLSLQTCTALLHPDDISRALADIERHRNGEPGLLESENRVRCKDGSWRWIQARGKVMAWNSARAPSSMIGTFLDVTERKRAEAELRQAATVFRFSREGMVVTNLQADIVAVNPAFMAITGYLEEELIGHNPRLLNSGRHDRLFFEAMWNSIKDTGSWHGEIWNRRKNHDIYLERLSISSVRESSAGVTHYIGIISDVTQLRHSEQELARLSSFDPLTELPNRNLLLSRLSHALDHARRVQMSGAVLLLGIDHFKHINNSLGHSAGDDLLRIVAKRLKHRLRQVDLISRIGGDQFVVVLEDLSAAQDASFVAKYLIDVLEQEFILDCGSKVHVSASIGISLFEIDGDTAEALLQNADSALNNAKKDARSSFCFYSPALTDAAKERLTIEEDLRRGLEQQEFVVFYQPLINLVDREINGFEALVRWVPPDGKVIMPDRFIPVAEETGLIIPLGEWVLRESCRQMKDWLDAGLRLKNMAVNLSPRQFQDHLLADKITTILAVTGLPAHYLELEITEGAIMQQGTEALGSLNRLKDLGIRLAIDDFGTGYSSLAYLKRFPIDKLKIDRSFVRDIPEDRPSTEIVSTIIAMGKHLNLLVLAEGIETELQLEVLQRFGCDFGQGYLFSRPVPAADAVKLLSDVRRHPVPPVQDTAD
jgi:diguanylate cyclase (GGDEF)-like protein/PAS domain S-box-containing protein